MTSLIRGIRQVEPGTAYYIPLSSLSGMIYSYSSGTSTFSTAAWMTSAVAGGKYVSTVNGAAKGLLKDMGKTVVSANRIFRKIQVLTSTTSTFGVAGATNSGLDDYLTGYIELGILDPYAGGAGVGAAPGSAFNFAPVAKYGR